MSASPVLLPTAALPAPEMWVPYERALRLCGWTSRWMSQQIRERKIVVRDVAVTLRNGRTAREVAVSSLPATAQQRFATEGVAPEQPSLPGLLAGLPVGPQLVTRTPRVHIPLSKMSEADAKQTVLEPVLAMAHAANRDRFAALTLRSGKPVDSAVHTRRLTHAAKNDA